MEKRKFTKRRKSELLPRHGLINEARISMHINVDRPRGGVHERRSSIYVDVIGEFTEPVSGITQFSILIFPVSNPVHGQVEISSVGGFSQFKPIAKGVVELSPDEFQNLMLLATSGNVRSCYLAFNEPYRGCASIVSISFSNGPPEE